MKIIGISGKMGSGKNTIANYIVGDILVGNDILSEYSIDKNGTLLVPTETEDGIIMCPLDMCRKDEDFLTSAHLVWPSVRVWSFADNLKLMCMSLFDLSYEQCYGSDEDKNSKTSLLWENMPDYHKVQERLKENCPKGNMTSREILQYMGTEICRKMKNNCWAESCIKSIIAGGSEVNIITDVRFVNEADTIRNNGGKLVRLTRNIKKNSHISELALDKYENFDIIIDNSSESSGQTYETLRRRLLEWEIVK